MLFWILLVDCNRQNWQARVWYDRAETASATRDTNRQMAFLFQAERGIEKATDQQMAGKIYLAESRIFKEFYDLNRASSAAEKARIALLGADDFFLIGEVILEEIDLNLKMGRLSGAGTWIENLQNETQVLSQEQTRRLEALSRTFLFISREDYSSAEKNVAAFSIGFSDEIFRQDLLSRQAALDGDSLGAQRITALRDKKLVRAGVQETKLFAISADLIQQQRERSFWSVFLLVVILILLLVISTLYARYAAHKHRRETVLLQGQIADQYRQTERAEQLAFQAKEAAAAWKEMKPWVLERIETLNKISVQSLIPDGGAERRQTLESLLHTEDQDQFLDELYKQFLFTHPAMAEYLESKGLTPRERSFCMLLCHGLRGKEIAGFLNLSNQRVYNIQNEIRRKLDLHNQRRNLQTVLLEIMNGQT